MKPGGFGFNLVHTSSFPCEVSSEKRYSMAAMISSRGVPAPCALQDLVAEFNGNRLRHAVKRISIHQIDHRCGKLLCRKMRRARVDVLLTNMLCPQGCPATSGGEYNYRIGISQPLPAGI